MMKRFTILFFALVCSFTTVWGAYGIFQAGVTINGVTYFEDNPTSGANTLNGKNFSVVQGSMFNLTYSFAKTFKNSGSNVCGAKLHYAVYPAAGSPTFTNLTLCFDFNIGGGGDQQWSTTGSMCSLTPINLAAGLTPGNYKIAVFYSTPGGNCGAPVNEFLSNGGANYIANLTVTAAMPVNLTAFDARRAEAGVQLSWQTAAERDHAYYEVERSATMGAWLPLGIVKGQGNTTELTSYTFTDAKPLPSDNYYRLAVKDLDGNTTYSPVVRVAGNYASAWQISPNPAADVLVLRFVEKEAPATTLIRLYNAQGTLALQYAAAEGATAISVPLTSLAAGTYWVDIQSGDGIRTALQPVIKQ